MHLQLACIVYDWLMHRSGLCLDNRAVFLCNALSRVEAPTFFHVEISTLSVCDMMSFYVQSENFFDSSPDGTASMV